MADFFQNLQPKPVPEPAFRTGVDKYVKAYHEKYKVISKALEDAAQALKAVSQASGMDTLDAEKYLAILNIHLMPKNMESGEPARLVVDPTERFYFQDPRNAKELLATHSQVQSFNGDLERLMVSGKREGMHPNLNSSVAISHSVYLRDFIPYEDFQISSGESGKAVREVVNEKGLIISPRTVDTESNVYRLNQLTSLIDTTEFGENIPVGHNRLALLLAAQHFLVEKIKGHQGRISGVLSRLERLGTQE